MKLNRDRSGFIPVVYLFWILIILSAALSWIWLSSALITAMGITTWGIVKLGRKKYITGVITILVGVAAFILIYLLVTGGITLW